MEGRRFEHGTRAGQIVCAALALVMGVISILLAGQGEWGPALACAVLGAPFAALVWRSRRTGIWVDGGTVTVVKLVGSQTVPAADIERVERVVANSPTPGGLVGLVTVEGQTILVNSVVWPEEGHPGHDAFSETLAGLRAALAEAAHEGPHIP